MSNTLTSPITTLTAAEPSPSSQGVIATDIAGADLHPKLAGHQTLLWVMLIVAVSAVLLVAFSLLLHQQLSSDFPDRASLATRADVARHYLDAPD